MSPERAVRNNVRLLSQLLIRSDQTALLATFETSVIQHTSRRSLDRSSVCRQTPHHRAGQMMINGTRLLVEPAEPTLTRFCYQ